MTRRSRSPVLGYNHNLRHGGRVFHVQTEDSGPAYARVYTHLFYEGTILASKKQEYDPAAPENLVRAAMQKQHKQMILELTHAEHDPRIGAFFAARGEAAVVPNPTASVEADPPASPPPVVDAQRAPPADPAAPVAEQEASGTMPFHIPAPEPLDIPIPKASPPGSSVRPKPMVVISAGAPRRPPVVLSDAADGVVVRRNVVIDVGGGQPPVHASVRPATASSAVRGRGPAPRQGTDVAANRGRPMPAVPAASPPVAPAQAQPVASTQEIRMPWESQAPAAVTPRAVGPANKPTSEPPRASNAATKIRMPWDAAPTTDAFADPADKGLDDVILEYLAEDAESE
jgi:hypothetical protein